MILHRWDVVFIKLHEGDRSGHPAVVLSHPDILGSEKKHRINLLMGTKKQPAEVSGDVHVVLDAAEGLDFATLVDCSFIYVGHKSSILHGTGVVSVERRKVIQRKIRGFFGLG